MFNTPDNQEFIGVQTDASLHKAKKGTAEYNAWLEKYKAKRGRKQEIENNKGKDTLKARKALAGISTVTADSVKAALENVPFSGATPLNINGVHVVVHTDKESTQFQVHSVYSPASHTAATFMLPKDKLTKKDLGDVAVAINKIVTQYADYYLPKADSQVLD